MPLLLPYDASGLDGKLRTVIDDIIGRIQIWAGKQEGINASERLNELSTGIASLATVPTGAGFEWFTDTAPTGYIFLRGDNISRTTYANLFTLWGTTYGVGDGSTTFGTPDMRRRMPIGKASSGTVATLGLTGGAFDHTHTLSGSTANESTHTHGAGSYATPAHSHGGITGLRTIANTLVEAGVTASVSDDVDHDHQIDTQAAMSITGTSGAGSAHSHGAGTLATAAANPPYFVVNYVVKT